MKKIIVLLVVSMTLWSCDNDDDKTSNKGVGITFSESWDKSPVTFTDLNATVFTNENGDNLQLDGLRYLISNMVLTNNETGQSYQSGAGFFLRDISETTRTSPSLGFTVPPGTYKLSFIYGFSEEDNIDGEYENLNIVSWNWPEMLGGGYHFLQMDGSYNVNIEPSPFNFHNGTARVSDGVFEQNFVPFSFDDIEIGENSAMITINMDIAEWFKNPHTWNLNELDTQLMPNYTAQKMMQDNAQSVFSVSVE
ncbi:hypothetical protein GCM10009117_07220 [Gangjinia marincola]|uniref:Copper-binding protein MbnP-like domain-containing protein n=1 Tax=Gangjinia marincola TaxID=578463 RepID=A0ABN1MEM4_9FLAO